MIRKKRMIVLMFVLFGIIGFADDFTHAVWYNIYEIDLGDRGQAEAQIDADFRDLEEMHINKLFLMIKNPNGRVFYKSAIAKPILTSGFISYKTEPLYWDPVQYLIEKGKQYNIKICAYMNVFSEEGYFLEEHPEYAEIKKDGKVTKWVSPSIEKVRERIAALAVEIVTKYQLDGFQLDRVRYEELDSGYNKESIKEYEKEHRKNPSPKDENFVKYRMGLVDKTVEEVVAAIRKAKPEMKISASVFHTPTTAKNVLQNWGEWYKKELFDEIYAMSYTNEPNIYEKYLSENSELIKNNKSKTKIIMGIGLYYKNMNPESAEKEIKMTLENQEVSGICYFNFYNAIRDNYYKLIKRVDINNRTIQ